MQRFARLAAAVAFVAVAPVASAQYTQTLPEYQGTTWYSSYPSSPFTIGTFTGIPGGPISGATISGTFGNSFVSNTADVRLFLNSVQVAQCAADDPNPDAPANACGYSQTPTAWSYTFTPTDFAALSGPTATLTAIQDSDVYTQLGPTTLSISYGNVTTTPEPSSMALLGTGLIGLVPMVRRRRK